MTAPTRAGWGFAFAGVLLSQGTFPGPFAPASTRRRAAVAAILSQVGAPDRIQPLALSCLRTVGAVRLLRTISALSC